MEENKVESIKEERKEYAETLAILMAVQQDYTRSNKMKDKIIVLLIVCMMLEAVAGYAGFLWYESQFETVTTTTETTDVELESSGEGANATYNDVEGDQYNDNATHNEGIKKNE